MEHQPHTVSIQTETYYTCPMHPEIHEDKPGSCPKCGMNLVIADKQINKAVVKQGIPVMHDSKQIGHQLQKYTCPMHPHIIQDGPGKCPLCGMKLEPVIVNAPGKHGHHSAMIADFKKRFYLVAALTVPIMLYHQ
ncbi:MAG: heavy metal-binding domain-containing protein [Chitinophagaceae bacterium]